MNNIALGQYIDRDSFIHKLDPRTKIMSMIFMMISVFLIPNPSDGNGAIISFSFLGAFFVLLLLIVLLTKISILKYLKSLKQIAFLVVFMFVVQILTPYEDKQTIIAPELYFSIYSILIVVAMFVLFVVLRKYIHAKLIVFLGLAVLAIYIFTLNIGTSFNTNPVILKVYKTGLYKGAFFSLRIMLVIMVSSVLTLTTKPTDLTNALEWLLHPLTYFKINVSIFAMMISLALRFIPTLFNETNKILKAQSSRGVDFKEGNLKSQIGQIVSLLIPMFVISYKRAEDLADAMEARGYNPGAERTRINVLKFKLKDLFSFIIVIGLFAFLIVWGVIY